MLKCLLLAVSVGAVFGSDCVNVYHGECHSASSACPSRFQSHTLTQGVCGSTNQQCCYHATGGSGGGSTQCETTYHGECHSTSSGCPSRFHHYTVNFCGFLQQCCYNTQSHATSAPSTGGGSFSSGACGLSAVANGHRIIGGTTAQASEFPWQVMVYERGDAVCGGTLIDRQYVITAAHCFDGSSTAPSHWSVGVGSIDSNHLQMHQVSAVNVHSNFNKRTFANDITLLKLSSPVDITGRDIRTACLPHANDNFHGQTCTVSGWGVLHENGNYPRYLHKVDLPILQDSQCRYYLGRDADYTTKELCAGFAEGGKDSCEGDSGGPLVCFKDGVWKLAGVVSWGYGCADRETPGIYTKVSEYLNWIASHKH